MGYIDWDLVTSGVQWSPETYRLLGYAPGEHTPTLENTVGMVPVEDRAFVEGQLQAAMRGEADYDVEHRMVRADGRVIHVHAHAELMRDERGRPVRMLGTVVDITERKHAEEAVRISAERLRLALKAASAGIWEWHIRKNEILWSRASYQLEGPDPGVRRLTFDEWLSSLHPDDVAATSAAIHNALEDRGTEHRVEFRVLDPRRGERWMLSIGRVDRAVDGIPERMTGIVIDITDRKRAEQYLREVDRRRGDFLGVLSHELRNPLAPIRNSLYILDRVEPGGEQARRALAVIDRQVGHLTRLVDDLLDVTRISSGKIRLQPTRLDLVDLVRRTVDDHRSLLADREVVMDLPAELIWIRGDATRLAQVLGNLLSNAAKFTPEGGRVKVSLRRERARAALEVADTGMGIDGETLRRLFVPFAQADRSLDRSRGGLGLGLALVRTLVELHGGEVRAHSDGPGRGSRFVVELPLEGAVTAASEQPPRQAGGRGKRVLVIEDNRDAAETLAEALGFSGHEVEVAFDGAAGLARAREFHPEVILCDIGLPGDLDGYEVARALQQDADLACAYRIALTGYAQPEDQRRARDAGYDAHFGKPPDMVALERLLAAVPPRSRS
jgi:PAS domain S-box-containing protein